MAHRARRILPVPEERFKDRNGEERPTSRRHGLNEGKRAGKQNEHGQEDTGGRTVGRRGR